MAESLLFPVVRGVAGKAAGALVQVMTRMLGIDGDRSKLERQFLAVQCKLAAAEEKCESSPYIKRWMKDFRTVAYEADGILDDFQYEAMRHEAEIGGGSKTRKVLSHFTSHSPLLFRLTMSRRLHNVLEKINRLVQEMNTFGLADNRAEAPSLQAHHRQTHAALDGSAEIFGRDDDREVVVRLLLDQRDGHKLQMLPIFGMGGLGKTTLAKMVYNDRQVQQHFQLKMWHCVSDNFDVAVLVKSIIELARNESCHLPDTIEMLRRQLEEVIGKQRFLLVLDDVWNEEEGKWEDELKPLLSSVGGPGSVVLVTSRSQRVASIMGTLGPHKLACLSDDDSWRLFSKKAFANGIEEQAEFVAIGRRIVKKCRGLPLALKAMGGLMSSKEQLHEWEAIEERNIGDNARGKHEVLPILKLSYRHLTSEMKQCFAFCAVFPKDRDMEKDLLIQLWMANGLFQEDDTMDMTQKGEFIFNYLVWMSFLQDVKSEELQLRSGAMYESTVCKMHDLIHDLAKHVTDECAVVQELVQQKASLKGVRYLQITQSYGHLSTEQINRLFQDTTSLFFENQDTTSLCTLLMIPTNYKDLKELKMTSLRALRCQGSYVSSGQVLNAKHLRYLDISGSDIARLPESVCMLYNLQTVKLNHCWNLQQLPEGTNAMRKLIHLYLIRCHSLEQMPSRISLLNNLRTLTTFIVDTEAGRGIEELRDLRHLGNRLELYNLRKIKSGSNAKEANLHQKQNVRELLMHWGRGRDYIPEDEVGNDELVLESLAPHSKLRTLELCGYGGLEISRWMGNPQMFQCLRKLTISNCSQCNDLPIVWFAVSLEYLWVENMYSLNTLCKSPKVEAEGHNSLTQIFPKLKKMTLRALPSLERWMEDNAGQPDSLVTFPMIQELAIQGCPKLASVPGSPVLKKLTISGCCSLPITSLAHLTVLSELDLEGRNIVPESMPLGSWPSLVKLTVWWPIGDEQSKSQGQRSLETVRNLRLNNPTWFIPTSGLPESHLGIWECFDSVEELTIRECNKLVCWPVEKFQALVRLRTLGISRCAYLEGNGSSSEESLVLPHLEMLDITECNRLQEIPKLHAPLKGLSVSSCDNLVALPSNLGDLDKLRDLYVSSCPSLKELPAAMDGLTSLENLGIWESPRLGEFPQGLLQQLPALKSLTVQCCPELGRRCREGGEYFSLVSSIPCISIFEPKRSQHDETGTEPERSQHEETGSRMKKLVRRLLPSCANTNAGPEFDFDSNFD